MTTRSILSTSFAALLGLTIAGAASAQALYPRTVGTGEDTAVEYGPQGPQGNVFGGGGAVTTTGNGVDLVLHYAGAQAAQRPLPGQVPVTVGTGENETVAYATAGTPRTMLSAQ